MERGETSQSNGDARPDDALRRLERRLEQASDAAERLMTQAAGEAAARMSERVKPPPRGWQLPEEPSDGAHGRELAALLQALQSLRDLIPPELERRLIEAVRELLLALRALIDWYLERIDRRRAASPEVQDIPIL
jgi:hypothetical protein